MGIYQESDDVKMTVIIIRVPSQICKNRELVYVKRHFIIIIRVILQMCENRELVYVK